MKKLWKRIRCFIEGHEREEIRNLYGFLTNGQPLYEQSYSKCSRCGK